MSDPDDLYELLRPIEDRLKLTSFPICGVRGRAGAIVGSGFLLGVGPELLLVTAAHVLHYRFECGLQILIGNEFVPFAAEYYSTGPEERDGKDFGYDIGFCRLDEVSARMNFRSPVLSVEDLDVDDLPANS